MDPVSQDDGGGGKKVGLARLAKNHSLSTSQSSLQNVEESGSLQGPQRIPDAPTDHQVSPLRSLGKQGPTVNLLPNKIDVSTLSGQMGDRRGKPEEDTLSHDSLGSAPVPCSDPNFIKNSKACIRPSQSLPLSNSRDAVSVSSEEEASKARDSKMKRSSPVKKSPTLLPRRDHLAPPQVKRSISMTELSESVNQTHGTSLTIEQSVEMVSESSDSTHQPHLSSVRFPELEVNSSVPLTPLTVTSNRINKELPHSPKLTRRTAFRGTVKERRKESPDPPVVDQSHHNGDLDFDSDFIINFPSQRVSSPKCVPYSHLSTNGVENGVNFACPLITKPCLSSASKKASGSNSEYPAVITATDRNRQCTNRERRPEKRSKEKRVSIPESPGLVTELKHASSVPDSLLLGDGDLHYPSSPFCHTQLEEHLGRAPSWYGYKSSAAESFDNTDGQEELSGSPLPGCRSASLDELNTLDLSVGLPLLSPFDVKKKNYLLGRMGNLLGASELDRYFPSRTITLFIATWNMNGKEPPMSLEAFLLPDEMNHMPDMFVVGTQESGGSRSEWEVRLQATIGPSHILFTSAVFGVLHLTIFLRRDLIWFCSVPEEATYSFRPGIAYKTKGGVGIGFQFFGTRMLFINSHLTAHEEKQALRIQNFRTLTRSLDIPRLLPRKGKNKDVTHQYDCVFWLGDLNFRLSVNRDHVFEKLKHVGPDTFQHLLQWDQLSQARHKGEAFGEFDEGTINFLPTFKYDPGTDHYDSSSKQRVPSYTDRILFKSSREAITCLSYTSCPRLKTSDHKPVQGIFQCKVRPGKDDVPLSAGLFNRDVYLEGLRRRQKFLQQPSLRNCPVQ